MSSFYIYYRCEPTTTGNSSHHSSHIRVPVPPSIPLPRDAMDISLGLNNREYKPPSGGSSRTRPGRLRTRLLNKELHRIRSSSRERVRSAERQTVVCMPCYICYVCMLYHENIKIIMYLFLSILILSKGWIN